MRRGALLLCGVLCAGCASSSNDIQPQYVSEVQYQHLSCGQIGQEAQSIRRRFAEVSGVQDEKASNDAVATGVALVLFWPAAFFIKGDGATAAELGRLKGEFEALERASNRKGCGLRFQRAKGTSDETKAGRKKKNDTSEY
ncbi:MAG: hypothetical protein WAN86_02975 [Hyphomicrobiaceae bacterium]